MEKANFTQTIKAEILAQAAKYTCAGCRTAFLYGAIRGAGSLLLGGGLGFSLTSTNRDLVVLAAQISAEQTARTHDVIADASKKRAGYTLNVADCPDLLTRIGIIERDENGMLAISDAVFEPLLAKKCCSRAFFCGIFAASGSAAVPAPPQNAPAAALPVTDTDAAASNLRYRLDINLSGVEFAESLARYLCSEGLAFKHSAHGDGALCYACGADNVADALVYLGAKSARFLVEDVIISRKLRNNANRQTNCISANIDKALRAGEQQTAQIKKLKKSHSFATLSDGLKEVCEARLNNPDATVQELADMLNLTKSGIAHRLRKIKELAEALPEYHTK